MEFKKKSQLHLSLEKKVICVSAEEKNKFAVSKWVSNKNWHLENVKRFFKKIGIIISLLCCNY